MLIHRCGQRQSLCHSVLLPVASKDYAAHKQQTKDDRKTLFGCEAQNLLTVLLQPGLQFVHYKLTH